jgi:CheY-like chemotaxis protein
MAHLLVIEDDDLLREIIAVTLRHAGHSVAEAVEGRQGCELFHAQPADLVLTDLIMPGQEGIETIMQLRQTQPDLPIIAMSGGATHARFYLEIAAKLGARRILAKPFTAEDLLRSVHDLLATLPSPQRDQSA